MGLEDFSRIIAELRKKLIYIAAVFGIVSIMSFPYMGEVIKKIENDLYYSQINDLNLSSGTNASRQLVDISHNLSLISNDVASSAITQNLTKISSELLNISHNLNSQGPKIVTLTPLEGLMIQFKMSLMFGAIVASLLVIYYAYRGFKGRLPSAVSVNKSLIIIAVLISIILFLLGAAYSYFYMLPFFLKYTLEDTIINLEANPNYSLYEFISFVVMTMVILGFSFELPLVMTILVRFGITSRKTLAHYRKHAYIILLIVAAWVTPDPTMFSQIMVMLPFVILYEASLLGMKMMGK
ncbi:MAG: hypothetical protein FIB08_01865 [Candidatus Methanoperedens sp.]|nr:hypothetical protein [Candidatus Methanoperedens sp.]